MKKILLITLVALLGIGCKGQESKADESNIVTPKGTWKVDKKFDDQGNLVQYDSIYSWSSNKLDKLSVKDKDSLMQSFRSKFFNDLSGLDSQDFEDSFSQDSLFSKQFFNHDFFESHFQKDFVNMDDLRKEMIAEQKKLIKEYQSDIVKPESIE
ncbi:hypothetical protein [Formosa sp. L2A11]|uniref:hypothetical protein n=1 Tax=Formosa sp. L2A11 TaxID=2686363 RepID=UPI00131CA763|nr:hypothetical protein [Formosa sp. L2A11]